MQLRVEKEGVLIIVTLAGRLDAASADELRETIGSLVARGFTRLLVDMEQLEFIGSAGLGVIVAADRMLADAAGQLVCCGLSDYVAKVLRITRVDRKITLASRRDDALGLLYAS